ncbi:MAG: hypothetical protein J6W23_00745, partial [Victivallales bacterium]|nr:hypothetical protein [Victivallales bacterium]
MKVDLYLRRKALFTTAEAAKDYVSLFVRLIVYCLRSSHVFRFMSPSVFQKQRNSCELPHDVVPASRSDEQPPSRWSR